MLLPGTLVAAEIPPAYQQVAHEYGIPPKVLYAVALTESNHRGRPWPWTLNVAGQPERYDSYSQVVAALKRHLKAGERNVDVGLMQVNWRWQPQAMRDPVSALEPWYNVRSGARILADCYRTDWLQAAGCYHRPAGGEPARRYRAAVARHLKRLP